MKNKQETFKSGLRRRYLAVFDEVKEKQKVDEKTLCKEIGMLPTVVSQIRSGKRGPTLEQVVKICEKFDYDLLYVIRGDDKIHTKKPTAGKVTIDQVYKEVQELKAIVTELIEPMIEALVLLKNRDNPIDPKEWIKKIGKS